MVLICLKKSPVFTFTTGPKHVVTFRCRKADLKSVRKVRQGKKNTFSWVLSHAVSCLSQPEGPYPSPHVFGNGFSCVTLSEITRF